MMYANLVDIFLKSLSYKVFKTRVPLVTSISITSRCNLRCLYCYSYEDLKNAKDVPFEELRKTIDEFYNLGTRVLLIQGGEPTLHTRLGDIIRYVKSKGIYCAVTTNGVFFEKHLDAMKLVNQVQLSLDGDERITEKFRRQNVYGQVTRAMELCREHRIPFHIHSVLVETESEEETLEHLTILAHRYRTYLNFAIPCETGAAKGNSIARRDYLRKTYESILERKRKGMPSNNSYSYLQSVIEWGRHHGYDEFIRNDDEIGKKRYPKCVMGNLVCWLDSTGMLYPCGIKFGEAGFGYSIKEHGIKGAWERLRHLPCHHCSCSTEFNNLLGLKAESVINGIKFAIGR